MSEWFSVNAYLRLASRGIHGELELSEHCRLITFTGFVFLWVVVVGGGGACNCASILPEKIG